MITQPKRIKGDSIPVVLYLRMSSDKQDTSIEDQRAALIAHAAKHGYTILREYIDEGISGWKSRQRRGFTHLIADAANGEFKLVLVWDQSRFSRFEPLEASFYWHQLKVAGVAIETVKEGRLDFDSLGGWLTASVQQHGKAEYCRSLGIDVARGQRAKRSKGAWLSSAPYGFAVDRQTQRLILGPDNEIEAVRQMFKLRMQGWGPRRIVKHLNEAGIKPRRSGQWHIRSLVKILTSEIYAGHSNIGKYSRPQFASKAEAQLLKNTHPAIIPQATWDRVQTTKYGPRPRAGIKEESQLGGLLVCGHCGATMYHHKTRGHYICGSYHSKGNCTHNKIDSRVAMRLVASKIREHVLFGTLENLTEVVERRLAKRAKAIPKVDAAAIRKQIAAVDTKLEAATERLVSVAPSLVKTVEAKMLDLQRQREALQGRLQTTPKPKKPKSAKAIAADLWRLDDTLRNGSPSTIRIALHRLIEKVEIRWEAIPHTASNRTGQTRRKPVFASIHLTTEDTSFGT